MPSALGVQGRGETEEESLREAKEALHSAPARFERDTDPGILAKEQGVHAADFDKLLGGDFWPEDEGQQFLFAYTDAV